MRTIKDGVEGYISVSTVTLYKEDESTYPFHCIKCGNTSNIIKGKVTKITPILEPSYQIPVVSTCKSCREKYVFQDGTMPNNTINVVLSLTPAIQSFYCYLGGGETKFINKILEYNANSTYSYIIREAVSLPYITACTNPQCPLVYKFSQFN